MTSLSSTPSVKRHCDQQLKEFVSSLDAKRDSLPPDTEFGEPKIELVVNRNELLCKVEYVGDDYIMVRYGKAFRLCRVIATGFIATIDWHKDDELSFATSVQHISKTADRTKRVNPSRR